MTTPNLAKIEQVTLKEAWPNEARDFTPWLFDNIEQLGEILGVQLAGQDTEVTVGKFSLDILATDIGESRRVVVENQLDTSDHKHLGQLLTYAADSDDSVLVVWVARDFEDEHHQALNWLNRHTDEKTMFFGVTVELWRIGESEAAPRLSLVASPEGWQKKKPNVPPAVQSERMEKYKNFFQSLIDTLREEHRFTRAQKGQAQSLYLFASGYREFKYWASFIDNQQARVDLRIETGTRELNVFLLESLAQYQQQLEEEFGKPLDWDRMDGYRACRISTTRPGTIDDDAAALAEIRRWMVDHLLKFKKVFDLRLREVRGNLPREEQQTIE